MFNFGKIYFDSPGIESQYNMGAQSLASLSKYNGWSAERVLRHVAYWCFWLLLYSTVNSEKVPMFWEWIKAELIIMLVKLPYTYTMMYVLVPKFLIRQRYLAFFCWAMVITLLGGEGIALVYDFYVGPVLFGKDFYFDFAGFFYKTIDLVYISTFPVIYKLHQFFVLQEKRNQRIIEQKLQAELELLKNQLQPHFLFNTLNNLYGLVLTSDKNAGRAVLHLSSMMSYMLYECNAKSIALQKEVAHLKNYIELEKIRYGDRLQVSFESGGDISETQIEPLLLSGFVENAFKHGPGNNLQPSWIRINLWVKDGELDYLVENSVHAPETRSEATPQESGIGLDNIKKRLSLIYPGRHHLKIEENADTFLIHLKLQIASKAN